MGWLRDAWPDAGPSPVGIAAVDLFLWPVVIRPFSRRADRYRWPYSFSRSPARTRASSRLAEGYARIADRIVSEHGRSVALICMEELDGAIAGAIHARMRHPDRARIFSSHDLDASKMTVLLRSLGGLMTSRYHASVLSLAAGVPQVAVGHDLRLRTLYEELGIGRYFVAAEAGGDLASHPDDVDEMLTVASARMDEVLTAPGDVIGDPARRLPTTSPRCPAEPGAAPRVREGARMGVRAMGRVVLLTGATGFVGTEIAVRLLDRDDVTLVCLVQAATDDAALREARRAWHGRGQLADAIGARVQIVAGDVTRPSLGLAPDAYATLVRRVTHIVHAAATVRFDESLEELRRTNVGGTANALALARAVHADHGLERLLHVSTAYVAGHRGGEVGEDDLSDRFGFENDYERTKYEAERLVRDAMTDLPVTVVRPAMIVGDSRTGEITTFNTFYVLVRHYLSGASACRAREPPAAGEHRAGRLRRRFDRDAARRPARRGAHRASDGTAGIPADRRRGPALGPLVGADGARGAAHPTVPARGAARAVGRSLGESVPHPGAVPP